MDPRSSEVLALASFPRFDPNAFVRGLTDDEFTIYFEDQDQPFVNRPTERLYPPASTFKVVTLAAGLEAGGYDELSRINCPAGMDGAWYRNSIVELEGRGSGAIVACSSTGGSLQSSIL